MTSIIYTHTFLRLIQIFTDDVDDDDGDICFQAVKSKQLQLIPDHYEKQWYDWLENIRLVTGTDLSYNSTDETFVRNMLVAK